MAKHFAPLLTKGSGVYGSKSHHKQHSGIIVNISARVGSISDNIGKGLSPHLTNQTDLSKLLLGHSIMTPLLNLFLIQLKHGRRKRSSSMVVANLGRSWKASSKIPRAVQMFVRFRKVSPHYLFKKSGSTGIDFTTCSM